MSGKPVTLSQSEYDILSRAKEAYEQSQGESADWGRFLLFLLGIYIKSEITKPKTLKEKQEGSIEH